MPTTIATITTARASIYLQQLCKHFGHKVPVTFTTTDGSITLPFGTCDLTANGDTLTLSVTGEVDALDRLQHVIADHLLRFAFRENPEIRWRSASGENHAATV
ncbi:DUF2218 domain-containing protein [Nitratireductor kimnyeongensis]|uniref:DUF2218 domain-containing protein n=1 Tax=Nitratireductor kimnyeongensis TaxID=430679 RepID=A0ABW0TB28_9HYPH|nr:DUF2218 domain-containing protein [Nitratireductor kimnyeongensis]QZZ35488.1 DUF2218 domain-containing protein [Nitratireductor kimnyeongensis]